MTRSPVPAAAICRLAVAHHIPQREIACRDAMRRFSVIRDGGRRPPTAERQEEEAEGRGLWSESSAEALAVPRFRPRRAPADPCSGFDLRPGLGQGLSQTGLAHGVVGQRGALGGQHHLRNGLVRGSLALAFLGLLGLNSGSTDRTPVDGRLPKPVSVARLPHPHRHLNASNLPCPSLPPSLHCPLPDRLRQCLCSVTSQAFWLLITDPRVRRGCWPLSLEEPDPDAPSTRSLPAPVCPSPHARLPCRRCLGIHPHISRRSTTGSRALCQGRLGPRGRCCPRESF